MISNGAWDLTAEDRGAIRLWNMTQLGHHAVRDHTSGLHVALLTAKTMRIVALLRVMPGSSRLHRILLALID